MLDHEQCSSRSQERMPSWAFYHDKASLCYSLPSHWSIAFVLYRWPDLQENHASAFQSWTIITKSTTINSLKKNHPKYPPLYPSKLHHIQLKLSRVICIPIENKSSDCYKAHMDQRSTCERRKFILIWEITIQQTVYALLLWIMKLLIDIWNTHRFFVKG